MKPFERKENTAVRNILLFNVLHVHTVPNILTSHFLIIAFFNEGFAEQPCFPC